MSVPSALAQPLQPATRTSAVRVVTATSLFDGHDAAINIVRRILQSQGAEVIHLGHDRSVDEIVTAAIQEDADAIAVSSYQGGHNEFFRYMLDSLRERGAPHIRVFAGGGGTILPDEVKALEAYGVAKIFTPEDGRSLGLQAMVGTIVETCGDADRPAPLGEIAQLSPANPLAIARCVTWLERNADSAGAEHRAVHAALAARTGKPAPVLGLTGTGGAGKSSVVDELVRRLRRDAPAATIGLLLVDPSRRRTGGALLGDRIRMNAIHAPAIYVRSLATRRAHRSLSAAIASAVSVLRAAGFDLIVVETAGIGQGDSEIVDLVNVSTYVMTPEFGAPSQLEKIDMLDLADVVILNKADRPRADDALRDVRKQWKRNRTAFEVADADVPVFATVASQWNDPGMERAYAFLRSKLIDAGAGALAADAAHGTRTPSVRIAPRGEAIVPSERVRYLAEIASAVRDYRQRTELLVECAADAEGIARAMRALGAPALPIAAAASGDAASTTTAPSTTREADAVQLLRERYAATLAQLDPSLQKDLQRWPETRARYDAEQQTYRVRAQDITVDNRVATLAGTRLPRVALPKTQSWSELTRFLRSENLPGTFPFTAGVFPFKRDGEEPGRMFAGEGGPERTNRRFHLVAQGQKSVRLSTAFDSVTLYGRDPDPRPDVYGKVGNSGVSVCTLDDAKKLYSGFDLCDAKTSVSMTINGPAPTVLAFFLNAAIDQQVEKHLLERGELERVRARFAARGLPSYQGALPETHNGLGLGLLGIAGAEAVDAATYARIRADVLKTVRGTVQADILKEDQAQNTCIFSTTFALKLMGDVQQYFVANAVRNFYSVSVSGYHIAEAGANPITQLAFTLANGFTYVENYLARGMKVDDFAPNFSFFFSNGLDAEYNVIGRVARRIWAIAMRECYGAEERSQKLKYHVQTSGRSLHAQEMAFNDIRTTLQALLALFDQCNSLHTNAYDEAVTTPTEESVRRALAIQLIIQRELGLSRNENPIQGAYVIDELTALVEDAVLDELDRLSARGGVLGAMETLYQRTKIQEESLFYEARKHDGRLPIIGVNTFENPDAAAASARPTHVARSDDQEKRDQLDSLRAFHGRNAEHSAAALAQLAQSAASGGNVFEALLAAVNHASLGQISDTLFHVGGAYRRAM